MYAPEIGRFLQPDPIGYDDGMNMYTYVGNNPLIWIDPYGLAVGSPGTLESMIPIWGSGRAAINHFQEGHYVRGVFNTALAVSDVFLVKAAVTGVAKGAIKLAGKHTWGATRKWITRKGLRQFKGQHMHHWLLKRNRGIGKYFPGAIKNQPWNLMPLGKTARESAALHRSIQGIGQNPFNVLKQWYYGTPRWFKALKASTIGRIGGQSGRSKNECK